MFYVIVLFAALYLFHLYCKSIIRFCTSKKKLDGKTVLVTGGTSGLGLQAAMDFANRNARVIIACPFHDEGMNAKKEIECATGNKKIIFKLLDLSSLQSVRAFATDILKTEDRLDILVNNAGVGTAGDFETADGMNFIMQVNYYGHFLLTLLLLPLLKKTGIEKERSRIINVSSILHRIALSDVSNYNKTGYYWFQFLIYSNSKFSLVLFARELSKKLNHKNVVVNCVDPGVVATVIYISVNKLFGTVVNILIPWFFNTPWEGVQTTLHAALDKEAGSVSGEFFVNCQLKLPRKMAYDDVKADLLWRDSMKLVGLQDEEVKTLLS